MDVGIFVVDETGKPRYTGMHYPVKYSHRVFNRGSSVIIINQGKAVIAGAAGPASAGPLF